MIWWIDKFFILSKTDEHGERFLSLQNVLCPLNFPINHICVCGTKAFEIWFIGRIREEFSSRIRKRGLECRTLIREENKGPPNYRITLQKWKFKKE